MVRIVRDLGGICMGKLRIVLATLGSVVVVVSVFFDATA
jgi:hypothetical protein